MTFTITPRHFFLLSLWLVGVSLAGLGWTFVEGESTEALVIVASGNILVGISIGKAFR